MKSKTSGIVAAQTSYVQIAIFHTDYTSLQDTCLSENSGATIHSKLAIHLNALILASLAFFTDCCQRQGCNPWTC